MSSVEKSLIERPKFVQQMWLGIVYFAPMFFSIALAVVNKLFSVSDFMRMLVSPALLCWLIVYIAVTTIATTVFTKKFMSFDGSEKSLDSCNKAINIFCKVDIVLPVSNSIIFPVMVNLASKNLGNADFQFIPFLTVSMGCTFLISLFAYVLWLEMFEPWTAKIHFEQKYLSMSLLQRYVLVYGFSTIGLICVIISPLFMTANANLEIGVLFWGRMFPQIAIGFILCIIDFVAMTRGVVHRLRRIEDFTQVLSEGNYTTDELQNVSREEIAILVNNVNDFYRSTKGLLNGVSNNIATSDEIAKKLTSNMNETATCVNQIIDGMGTVRQQMSSQQSGVVEAASATGEILNHIEALNANIEDQSAAVEESSAAVKQMVANIQSVTTVLEKNAAVVNKLGDASDLGQSKVEQAVTMVERVLADSSGLLEASTVIQNIAEQTNLLAMNAAIEAAHAGESGKGFAVVADEIRKLAEQSNDQGRAITESLEKLDLVISGVADSTRELQDQFEIIYDLAKTVKQQESYLMNAMQEQSAGSSQILEAMRDIDESTVNVRLGAEKMVSNSKQVADEMKILEESSSSVNRAIEDMVSKTGTIHSTVNDVNSYTEQNLESIAQVMEHMSKFKV